MSRHEPWLLLLKSAGKTIFKHLYRFCSDLASPAPEATRGDVELHWEIVDTRTCLADVGGLDGLKEWLARRAGTFGKAARDHGLPAPNGLLIVGIPGTDGIPPPLIRSLGGNCLNSVVTSEHRIKYPALFLLEGLLAADSRAGSIIVSLR